MSVHFSNLVWFHSASRGNARLVLLALADQANDDGECWPKIEQIAKRCLLDRATVHRQLAKLRDELGELTWEDRHAQGRSNLYRLTLSQIATTPVADCDQASRTVATTEPSLEPSKDTNTSDDALIPAPRSPLGPSLADLFEAFWKVYPRTDDVSKASALKSFERESKAGRNSIETAGEIILRAERFAGLCRAAGTEKRFIPHPSTWLNQKRYQNDNLRGVAPADDFRDGNGWW